MMTSTVADRVRSDLAWHHRKAAPARTAATTTFTATNFRWLTIDAALAVLD